MGKVGAVAFCPLAGQGLKPPPACQKRVPVQITLSVLPQLAGAASPKPLQIPLAQFVENLWYNKRLFLQPTLVFSHFSNPSLYFQPFPKPCFKICF